MDHEWGFQGVLRNPISCSVCASWPALDGHLGCLLPTMDASQLLWVPGQSTEVLACLQTCEHGLGGRPCELTQGTWTSGLPLFRDLGKFSNLSDPRSPHRVLLSWELM